MITSLFQRLRLSVSISLRNLYNLLKKVSAEHGILNASKYKEFQETQLFSGSDKPIMLFFMLINFKMPTIVGILTFMSRKIFMLS